MDRRCARAWRSSLLITGLTLVGEGLNETMNPALRRRRLQVRHLSRAPTERTTEGGGGR